MKQSVEGNSQAAEEKATYLPLIIGRNVHPGRYFILELISTDTDDMRIISCIPDNHNCLVLLSFRHSSTDDRRKDRREQERSV